MDLVRRHSSDAGFWVCGAQLSWNSDGIVLNLVKSDRGQFRRGDRVAGAIAPKIKHQVASFPQKFELLKTVKPVSGTEFK